MPDGNPLVAERQDSTTAYTGIGIAESAMDIYNGVENKSWVEGGIGAVGTGLEALSLAMDPVGTLLQYAVSWLMEHVKPLSDALDWLAGDADQIAAYAATWKNIGKETGAIAQDFWTEVTNGTAGWQGASAEAYRTRAQAQQDKIKAAGTGADTIGTVVEVVGVLVGAVREIVRDLVAECVATLIARIPQWVAEIAGTVGIATPHVVASAVALISKWVNRIKDFILKLTRSLEKLKPIMKKLGEIWDAIKKGLRSAPDGAPSTPNGPDGLRSPNTSDVPSGTSTTPSGSSSTPDTSSSPTGTPSGSTTTSPSGTPSTPDTSSSPTSTPSGSTSPSGMTSTPKPSETTSPSGTTKPAGTDKPPASTDGTGGRPPGDDPPPKTPGETPQPPRGLPENRAGAHQIDQVPPRQDGGLIDEVNGQSVDDYLNDRTTARTEEIREMRERGDISGKETGPVNAVGIDRRTGEVFEGVNGRPRDVIPDDELHPVLRQRMDEMRENGPYPQYNQDGTPDIGPDGQQKTTEFPHGDNPLRHAEVKVVNEMLWRRGPDVDASVMDEFQVDTRFPFAGDGPKPAPCCANCNKMLEGTPNNAGRNTHPPGHPDYQRLPR
jgi:hypothetical protein